MDKAKESIKIKQEYTGGDTMDIKKFKDLIIDLLKQDDRLWNETKTELNQMLLFDLIDKVDEKIISLFFENEAIKKKFFLNISDMYIFKNNELKFFLE